MEMLGLIDFSNYCMHIARLEDFKLVFNITTRKFKSYCLKQCPILDILIVNVSAMS